MKYGLLEYFRLGLNSCYSHFIIDRNIRIIKGYPRLINKKNIHFGKNFTAGIGLRVECLNKDAVVIFGKNCKLNDYIHIGAIGKIIIGDHCLFGSKITIVDHHHGNYSSNTHSFPTEKPDDRRLIGKDIIIGKRVWLGSGCVIMPGVQIGDGAIIGANSVVINNVDPSSIAVGCPAKIIKRFNIKTKKWEKID